MPAVQHSIISSDQILINPNLVDDEVEGQSKKRLYMDGDEIDLNGPLLLRQLKDKILVFCDKSEAISESSTSQATPSSYSRWTSGVKSNFMINKSI